MASVTTYHGIESERAGRSSDDSLMMRYAQGERAAFDILYARYKQPLYSYFYRNCNIVSVDELFQDVWLKVISSAPRYKSKNRFRSWIFTLAHNCLVDFYRNSKRRNHCSIEEEKVAARTWTDGASTEAPLISAELETAILEAVNTLPQVQREAFFLREELGFSIRDIAEIQGAPPEATKSRLRYAYKKLRQLLRENDLAGDHK